MLKKILITNYQKHESLELKFNDNVNVITGLTDAGKSGIFRAIEWLYNMSDISEKDYRREGTKQTSVKGWFDNSIQVERIRGNTINRYVLSVEGCEDKVFDSFGKNTPEVIAEVLGISSVDVDDTKLNLNFSSQDQLNFLLDSTYSDTLKAKLFNKLTGNEILDKIFKHLNKESLANGRELKSYNALVIEQENDIAEYSEQYSGLKKKLNAIKGKYKKIQEDVAIYENLKQLCDKLTSNKESLKFIEFKKSHIRYIDRQKIKDLKSEAEELNKMSELSNELESINESIKDIDIKRKKLKIIDVDCDELKVRNNTLQTLMQLKDSIDLVFDKQEKTSCKINELNIKQKADNIQLTEVWAKCDVCPLCGKENHE